MAIDLDWLRPFSETTEEKTSAVTYALTVVSGRLIIDATVSISSATKLLQRMIITPVLTGTRLAHKIKVLNFGTAPTYTSATNPADTVASNFTTAAEFVLSDSLNLDAFYTTAGNPRTDPA